VNSGFSSRSKVPPADRVGIFREKEIFMTLPERFNRGERGGGEGNKSSGGKLGFETVNHRG